MKLIEIIIVAILIASAYFLITGWDRNRLDSDPYYGQEKSYDENCNPDPLYGGCD